MLTEPVVNEPDISIVRLDIDAVTRDAHIERATAAHAAWIIAVFPFVDRLTALVFQPQRMQQPQDPSRMKWSKDQQEKKLLRHAMLFSYRIPRHK